MDRGVTSSNMPKLKLHDWEEFHTEYQLRYHIEGTFVLFPHYLSHGHFTGIIDRISFEYNFKPSTGICFVIIIDFDARHE
jgi:hypothetical protein